MNWDRLSARIEMSDGCWLWTGTIEKDGYGVVSFTGDGVKRQWRVHRLVYALLVGDITAGMIVGHSCHDESAGRGECAGGAGCVHRRCCNPEHLTLQTPSENVRSSAVTLSALNAAKTHCPAGHEYDRVQMVAGRVRQRYCHTCKSARGVWT